MWDTRFDGSGNVTERVLAKRTQSGAGFDTILTRTVPVDSISYDLAITHGGKEILRNSGLGAYKRIAYYDSTGWHNSAQPYQTVTSPNFTGSSNSRFALSHDGDTTFYTAGQQIPPSFQTATFSFGIRTNGVNLPSLLQYSLANTYTDPFTGFEGPGGALGGGTISPTGDFAIVVTRAGPTVSTYQFDRVSLPSGARTPLFTDDSRFLNIPSLSDTLGYTLLGLGISEDGTELSYYVHTAWDVPRDCVLRRYSLKTLSFMSSDVVSSDFCVGMTGGAPRARSRIARRAP